MSSSRTIRGTIFAGAALGATLFLVACSAPPGDSGGVIDSRERTRVDRGSILADSVSLDEFADSVSQQMAYDIPSISRLRSSSNKAVIEIGSLENKTRTPLSDFQGVQRKVFISLVGSEPVRNVAMVVERAKRVDRDIEEIRGDRRTDMFDDGNQNADRRAQYQLNDIYILNGTFYERVRGDRGQQANFDFDMTLTHAASGEIVFAKQYGWKQIQRR